MNATQAVKEAFDKVCTNRKFDAQKVGRGVGGRITYKSDGVEIEIEPTYYTRVWVDGAIKYEKSCSVTHY